MYIKRISTFGRTHLPTLINVGFMFQDEWVNFLTVRGSIFYVAVYNTHTVWIHCLHAQSQQLHSWKWYALKWMNLGSLFTTITVVCLLFGSPFESTQTVNVSHWLSVEPRLQRVREAGNILCCDSIADSGRWNSIKRAIIVTYGEEENLIYRKIEQWFWWIINSIRSMPVTYIQV